MPTANRPTINAVTSQSARVIGSLRARLLTSLVWKLWYSGFVGSVFGAISSLHAYISIFWNSSQTFRIHPLRSRRGAHLLAAACVLLSAPAQRSKTWSRRDRGRSASAGPRERRNKGSRRTRPSDPQCVERPRSQPDYRSGRLANGSALGGGSHRPVPRWWPPWRRPSPKRQ